jgi:hypothetical protein
VPDSENLTVKAMKAPGLDSPKAPPLANPGGIELGKRNHTVLTRGYPRDSGIRIGIGD